MNWLAFGYCVVAATVLTGVVALCVSGIRALLRRSTAFFLVFTAASSLTTITAQKTNNVNNLPPQQMMAGGWVSQTGLGEVGENSSSWRNENSALQLRTPNNNVVQTTVEDIARGWRVESVTTSENLSYEMPTNAALVGNWHVHGAASSFGMNRINFNGYSFPLGTNGAAFSSFWYFIDGRIRPMPKYAEREIGAVGVPMSAVPGQSRLWRLDGDDGSRVITWENFFFGGDTNSPVNAQVVLWPNGDFVTRSNVVETVCRRVNPDDWDDDGLANERDANPTSYDGDFFGVANALPTNANSAAYYWLNLSVTGLLGVATICVTCDGQSDLGDHLIIARTNQVCHIPLLAGATYAVDSNLPIGYLSVSSEYAEIVTNAENRLTVSLPLELTFERVQIRGGSDSYVAHTSPVDVGPQVLNIAGGCCSRTANETGFSWFCSDGCSCGGGWHGLWAVALWAGYSSGFPCLVQCPCRGELEPESHCPIAISIPDTLFPNDDVDTFESPGPWDMDCGMQKLADDDLARCSVSLESEEALNGTVRLFKPSPSGAYAYCGKLLGDLMTGFAYSEGIDPVRDWEVDALLDFTAPWALEAGATVLSYNGMSVRADWIPDEGDTVSVTSRFSVVMAVAEPICTSTTNVVENGIARTLVLNPCGVGVDRDAYFSVEVNPAAYPDSKITWSQGVNDIGRVDFMGPCSNTGRTVRVRGRTPGKVSLEVSVGGCPSDKPTFPLYVVTNKVRHISVWIAAKGDGSNAVRMADDVLAMLPTVNDVFSQIDMTFVIDSVNVLPNNKALSPYYYEESANGIPVLERKFLTFNELVDSVNADGIKCIFVDRFAEKSKEGTRAATLEGAGIVMTGSADALTLAHELGHELGRDDIYDFNGGVDVLGEKFWYNHAHDDWSNGCITGGSGYYRRGVTCQEIVLRLLMYGYSDEASSKGLDMTIGDVHGVYILQGEQCTTGDVNVGFWSIMNGGQ